MIYAYLRVSTANQDEENQRVGVDNKAASLGYHIDKYVIDHVSGTTEAKDRNLGYLLNHIQQGDVLIISELSRLGRRLFMLFRILEQLTGKGVQVYSVKEGYFMDGSLQSKVLAFAFGLAAEIERDMISQRTKEALALRKQRGQHLGRPFGAITRKHKLDPYRERILKWYEQQKPWAVMARRCRCEVKTVKRYLKRITSEEVIPV